MTSIVGYWAISGTFFLIYMTYQDLRHKRVIDDRFNYIMLGLTVSIPSHIYNGFWYVLLVAFALVGLRLYLMRTKIIGEADIHAIMWMMAGFAFLGSTHLMVFFIALAFCAVMYRILVWVIYRKQVKYIPYFPVLLAAFVASNLIMGMYLYIPAWRL